MLDKLIGVRLHKVWEIGVLIRLDKGWLIII